MPSLLIESAKILVDNDLITANLLLQDGEIKSISKLRPNETVDQKIDASGLIALPGLIDAHVHLRDLDLSYKETFETGTQAAAVGGFTTVLDMPNTRPPTTSSDALIDKISRAQGRLFVNVGFQVALIDDPGEVRGMAENGAIAFKLYMNKSLETFDCTDDSKLAQALRAVRDCNGILTIHAEDGAAIKKAQVKSESEGKMTVRDFLEGHTPAMEVAAVGRIVSFSKQLGLRTHICHITIPEAVHIAKRTLDVTCEATAHHLLVNQSVFRKQKTLALCVPPIRSELHRSRLWRLFRESVVDILASDHAPHTLEEKTVSNAWKAASGVPGLDTSLPVLFTQVAKGQITLRRLREAASVLPAKIFRLKRKGELKEGFDADVVLVDPKAKFRIRPESFVSKAKYSPFKGQLCTGRAAYTIVGGTLVAERGRIVGGPVGKVVKSDS